MNSDHKDLSIKVHSTFEGCIHPWEVGPQVAELQVLLHACGYSVRVNGDFGDPTEAAVRAFQQKHGLRVNGVVDPETWAALLANVQPGTRLLKRGHTGSDVHRLQELLCAHGHSIPVNGTFDADTERTVILFQRQRQLNSHGSVDPETWKSLRECPLSEKPCLPQEETINLGHWW